MSPLPRPTRKHVTQRPIYVADKKYYEEIMDSAREYLGQPVAYHPRYESYSYPQRYCVLNDMLKTHVLRESGDIARFIRLSKAINQEPGAQPSKHDTSLLIMCEWLEAELQRIHEIPKIEMQNKVVLSMLCWGERFIEKMLGTAFKSLMAEGNLPALTQSHFTIFYIQTNAAGRDIIKAAPIVQRMQNLGVHFEYCILPDELLSRSDEHLLYWLVGMGATVALAYARQQEAAFHHGYPDLVYNAEFFSEIVRLSAQHKIIIAPGPSADENILRPVLEMNYEDDETISIPCEDLAAHGTNALHISNFPWMVNNRIAAYMFPRSHVILWEGEESLSINAPHMNSLWIAPEVLKELPADRYYMSLDSELDLICTGMNFYVPQGPDKLFMLQMCEQARYAVNDQWLDAISYGKFIWEVIAHRDLFKIFARGQRLQINRNIRPKPGNVMNDYQIGAERAFLFNACLASDPLKGMKLKRGRSHEGLIFRAA